MFDKTSSARKGSFFCLNLKEGGEKRYQMLWLLKEGRLGSSVQSGTQSHLAMAIALDNGVILKALQKKNYA